MSDPVTLADLAQRFAQLSLMAVGGANASIPEMQRQVVEVAGWLSAGEFADLYALAQAAPGPNVLVVALIGWRLAGFSGAMVATACMCGPSAAIAYGVSGLWHRFRHLAVLGAIKAGLAPVTVGLILASGYLLTLAADDTIGDYAITAATVGVMLASRLNPVWILAGAAALGALGIV